MDTKEDVKKFGDYMVGLLNAGMVTSAIGVGANLGLFDIIVDLGKPSTCAEIAKAGGYKERYVREWLGIMVTGKVIDYNDDDKTYLLPDHRIPFLCKKGESNISAFMSGVPVVTEVAKELEECFKLDGPRGIPYSSYTHFHAWRETHLTASFKWTFSESILAQMPQLKEKLEAGITVGDAGCSMGVQVKLWAENFPKSSFIGYDIDQKALDRASDDSRKKGLTNLSFVYQDGCNLPTDWANKFDFIMAYDVVHDVPHPKRFLKEIQRSLKPGGVFLMVEIKTHTSLEKNRALPLGPSLYGFSFFHCTPVSYFYENGEGLGACWGIEKQREYLEEAGFVDIQIIESEEAIQAYNVCKKPE